MLASLLIIVVLLLLQAVTLAYFSYKTVTEEIDSSRVTFMEQLNNNIDVKIKEAEYALGLLRNYASESREVASAPGLRRGTVEEFNAMAVISGELRQIQSYVSNSLQLIMLTDHYLFHTSPNLPRSLTHKRELSELSFYEQLLQSPANFRLITGEEMKTAFIEYLLADLDTDSGAARGSALRAQLKEGITLAAAWRDQQGQSFLFAVTLPFPSVLQLGQEANLESFAVLSEERKIEYDPAALLAGSRWEGLADQAVGKPSVSLDASVDGKKYRVYSVYNSYTGLTFLSFAPEDALRRMMYPIWGRLLLLLAMSVACAGLLVALFWSRSVITPLRKLIQAIHRNSVGQLLPRFRKRGDSRVTISVKYKFLIAYGGSALMISYLLTFLCYGETRGAIEQIRFRLYESMAESAADNFSFLFSSYKNLSRYIVLDSQVQRLAASDEALSEAVVNTVTNRLLANPYSMSGLDNVMIYGAEGETKYALIGRLQPPGSSDLHTILPGFEQLNTYGYLYWSDTSRHSLNRNKFSIIREIRDIDLTKSYKKIGYINIEINELVFNSIFNHLKRFNYDTLIMNPSGHIISVGDKNYIGLPLEVYKSSLVKDDFEIIKPMKINDWSMVFFVPRDDIDNMVRSNLFFNLYISLAFMLVIGIFLIMFYNRLVMPLLGLNNLIRGIHSGQSLKRRYEGKASSYDEVRELGESFNLLMERINKLIRDNYATRLQESRLEARKKEVELNALQLQINPHFIYNTLDAINWMIMLQRQQEAVTMINSFSRLLRLSINNGTAVVEVLDELRHVLAYMDIQTQRYRDRLHFIIDVDKSLWRQKTLKLMLQPLVENAVNYGTESKDGLLTVILKGYMDKEQRMIFKVIDDGAGISREQLSRLNTFADSAARKGIGLRNVHERIQLYCGPEASIRIYSIYGAGTTVMLSLPLLKGDN